MNIFVLDKDPAIAAEQQCDQHVVKMVLESAQLLCSAFPEGEAPYRLTHQNHPCSIWTRETQGNFDWLTEHGLGLAHEYKHRYGRDHASRQVIEWCGDNWKKAGLPQARRTEFVQAMPPQFKGPDAVNAYRHYYLGSKVRFAKWTRGRNPPSWWLNKEVLQWAPI